MPSVDSVADVDAVIAKARAMAAEQDDKGRSPVVITPSHGLLFPLGSVPPNSKRAEDVALMEKLVPRNPPVNITAIALNTVETLLDGGWKRSIPFAGLLLGFAYIGHNVIITEGHPSILAAACKDADLLLVDAGMVPFLEADWSDVAWKHLRTKNIIILNRDGTTQLVRNPTAANSLTPSTSGDSRKTPKPWWRFW